MKSHVAASDKKAQTADFLGLWMQHAKHANLLSVQINPDVINGPREMEEDTGGKRNLVRASTAG